MGYTHYWDAPVSTEEQWSSLLDVTRKIVKQACRDGIQIQFELDAEQAPEITDKRIRFNGVGGDGHETFAFERNNDSSLWTFCKTAQKPYDTVVVAILEAARHLLTDFGWTSDGDPEDHVEGQALLASVMEVS